MFCFCVSAIETPLLAMQEIKASFTHKMVKFVQNPNLNTDKYAIPGKMMSIFEDISRMYVPHFVTHFKYIKSSISFPFINRCTDWKLWPLLVPAIEIFNENRWIIQWVQQSKQWFGINWKCGRRENWSNFGRSWHIGAATSSRILSCKSDFHTAK